MVVVSAAMPVIRIMPVRLVSIPVAVSGAGAVRFSVASALVSIMVLVLVTAGIAITFSRPAARPWHALTVHRQGLKLLQATLAHLQLYEQFQRVAEEEVRLRSKLLDSRVFAH